jgi:hypothetical protein
MTDKTREEQLEETGRNAYDAICEMVNALQCDYERLAELRGERDNWQIAAETDYNTWEQDDPGSAAELAALEAAAGDCKSEDDARQLIDEDPLSVQVREDWHSPGEPGEIDEYNILLATGGPAVRIVGTLGQFNEPATARLEVQDWFTPWTEYRQTEESVLLAYVSCFYFGE